MHPSPPASPTSSHSDLWHVATQGVAEQPMQSVGETDCSPTMPKPMDTGRSQCQPENKRRRVSLLNEVHHRTLAEAEPPALPCAPVTAHTTVAPQLCLPVVSTAPDRSALKTALYNLSADALSPADFIVLVNRFGYHPPLHGFPLKTLQPYDCLALSERACQQIIQHEGNYFFFEQLPPAAITCAVCIAACFFCPDRPGLYKRIPEHLKEPFFTQLVKRFPMEVVSIPVAERSFERLGAACCAYRSVLFNILDRPIPLVIEICRRSGYWLEHVPLAQRTYALCLKACETDGHALKHVPDCHKDEKLCRAAVSKHGWAYVWLPEKFSQNYEWQLLACRNSGDVLQRMNPERITYEMCRLACINDPLYASKHVPDRLFDDDLRWLLCLKSHLWMYEEFKPDSANFYERLLRENFQTTLSCVPVASRTPELYLLACKKNGGDLELVPEEERTPEICLAACGNNGLALQWVPKQYRTAQIVQLACYEAAQIIQYVVEGTVGPEWFVKAMRNRDNCPRLLLSHAKRLLSDADFQTLLHKTFMHGNHHQMAMLTLEQVSPVQKEELIEWMLAPTCWPAPAPPKSPDLCEMASPLHASLENPELDHLAMAALKVADHWTPPRYDSGRALLNEIERAMSAASVELASDCEPLFNGPGKIAGGRTFKIDQGAKAYYYKFQTKRESLKTLMQEGVIHTVRERHPELFGQLRSKLPGATRFFRLYMDQLPEWPDFDDPLAIQKDEKGRDYVHVYRYVASTDYSVYAHKADHGNPGNPHQKGEQGILTACHDIGRFIARGLVPTSTLPAFHDSESEREWMALHALLGYERGDVYPGTFGAWNSVATEYCDFGYGGFRDVGDFEPFGAIESYMKKYDAQAGVKVSEQEQCLCLLNAVCENLLAAHLIRARLRQSIPDYHYKNTEALQQTETFIEQSLVCFLKGMYSDSMEGECDRAFLRQRLNLNEPTYERWLARAAVEILYWTAKQPHPDRPDLPPFEDGSPLYSHQDGYALHLNRTGRLDPQLYPDVGIKKGRPPPAPVYPSRFHNKMQRLNLGCTNAVFPLTTLMRGLVRLCTGILTYDHTIMPSSSQS